MIASGKTIERLEHRVFSHDIGLDSSLRNRTVRMQGVSIGCATLDRIYLKHEPILSATMMEKFAKAQKSTRAD